MLVVEYQLGSLERNDQDRDEDDVEYDAGDGIGDSTRHKGCKGEASPLDARDGIADYAPDYSAADHGTDQGDRLRCPGSGQA